MRLKSGLLDLGSLHGDPNTVSSRRPDWGKDVEFSSNDHAYFLHVASEPLIFISADIVR